MFRSCFRISFLIVFVCFVFIGKVSSQTCLYTEEQHAAIQAELDNSRTELANARTQLANTQSTLNRLWGAVGGPADFCTGYMAEKSGVFTTPNFPGKYDNNLHCIRNFGGSYGKVVQISFTKFSTEISSTCNYDRVIIYIGGTQYGTYCGRNTPPTIRSSEEVKVEFITDGRVTRSGFVLQWTLEDEPVYTFKITPRKGTFDQAQHMCQKMNGRLVERALQPSAFMPFGSYWDKLKDVTSDHTWYWIGVTDRDVEGTWKYFNGERTNDAGLIISFLRGEPNNHWDREHCAVLRIIGNTAGLNDGKCSEGSEYGICEIPTLLFV